MLTIGTGRNIALSLVLGAATAAMPLAAQRATENTITPAQADSGWELLFDGHSMAKWRGYKSDTMPSGWHAQDGTLEKAGSADDIVTRREFTDFDLRFDWMLDSAGNAGVFYRGTEEYPKIYWTGPEYQLLDDAHAADGKNRLTSAGAAYGLYPSPAGIVHPANQWNHGRIVVRGNHVEHWMNGRKLLEYDLHSADWKAKVAASKFSKWPDYGMMPSGHIAIQGDHNGALHLRNIRIRPL